MSPRHTWDGDDDAEAVTTALNYLNSKLPQGVYAVSQPFVLIDPAGDYQPGIVQHVKKEMLEVMRSGYRKVVVHPDILVIRYIKRTDFDHKIVCAVELDGSIHDGRTGKKQTVKRNKKYEMGGIGVVQVNLADCHFAGIAPLEFMWDEVKKYLRQGF